MTLFASSLKAPLRVFACSLLAEVVMSSAVASSSFLFLLTIFYSDSSTSFSASVMHPFLFFLLFLSSCFSRDWDDSFDFSATLPLAFLTAGWFYLRKPMILFYAAASFLSILLLRFLDTSDLSQLS